MEFVVLRNFAHYMDAHIVLGRLRSEGIRCWLKDENISTLISDPVLTGIIGGIKLMVAKDQLEEALQLLET